MTDWIEVNDVMAVKAGDVADHKSRQLDPREVSRVEPGLIWLLGPGGSEIGPFGWENYTYTRRRP